MVKGAHCAQASMNSLTAVHHSYCKERNEEANWPNDGDLIHRATVINMHRQY
eukprot:m.33889 g.33889  ORF g.33889 m.33889 type:complete len:52 (+) comp14267_c0_seq2:383-538(+)